MFLMLSGMVLSGINVAHLEPLAVSPADRDGNRPLNQSANQSAFVFGRTAHVGLGISLGPSRFHRALDSLSGERLPTHGSFGILRSNCSQADTTQRNRGILANIALHGELHGGARRRIHGRGALKRQIPSATSL